MFETDFQITNKSPSSSSWTRSQDKQFERAIVIFPEENPDRWHKIAGEVPGKSLSEVRDHYDALVHDVSEIESGRIEVPNYGENSFTPSWVIEPETSQISFGSKTVKGSEQDRKKGVPWTEEEHRLFLIGLQKFGKGDWRSISRNAVVSRTPTQVASHAQKYFLRLNSGKKEKKRSSIHDITTDQSSSAAQLNEMNWAGPPRDSLVPQTMVQHATQTMGPPKLVDERSLVLTRHPPSLSRLRVDLRRHPKVQKYESRHLLYSQVALPLTDISFFICT